MEASPPSLPVGRSVHPALGWLLVLLGVGLSGSMAYIASVIHAAIVQSGAPGARSHWNGSPEFTRTVFELFGTVFVFGLVSIAGGIYILCTRRINRVQGAVMVALAFAMAYLGYVIIQTKDPR